MTGSDIETPKKVAMTTSGRPIFVKSIAAIITKAVATIEVEGKSVLKIIVASPQTPLHNTQFVSMNGDQ